MDKWLLILKLLEIRLYTIKILRTLTRNNINFIDWHTKTVFLLENVFGNSSLVENFIKIKFSPQKNNYYSFSINKHELESIYLKGLEESASILKEAIIKYSDICLHKKILISELDKDNLDIREIRAAINSIGCAESEKIALLNEFQKSYFAFQNTEADDYEKILISNQMVLCLNKIHPVLPGSLIFSSLIEILETFMY